MKVHVLQHVSFEGLGSLEPWLAARGWRPNFTRFHADAEARLPDPRAVDLILTLGGPMSVHDEDALPEGAALRALVDACGHELVPGAFIQDRNTLFAAPPERFAAIQTAMDGLMSALCG